MQSTPPAANGDNKAVDTAVEDKAVVSNTNDE